MAKLAAAKYASSYSEEGLADFIQRYAGKAGKEFLIMVFKLWYTMTNDKTSKSVIAVILAALGYTICPIDAIPDVLPFVGLTDDAGVLAATTAYVGSSITPEIAKQATKKVAEILK